MLLEQFDNDTNAVINPYMVVKHVNNFPDVTVSCFSKELFAALLNFFDAELLCELHSATVIKPIYKVTYN